MGGDDMAEGGSVDNRETSRSGYAVVSAWGKGYI